MDRSWGLDEGSSDGHADGSAARRRSSEVRGASVAARPARSGRRARPTGVGSALFLLVAVLALGSGAPARAQTADPSLSNLEVADNTGDAVALTPTFAPAVRLYIARLAHGVAQITVAPTLSNTGASYEILDNSGNALTDANDVADGFQVALVVGGQHDLGGCDGRGRRRLPALRPRREPRLGAARGDADTWEHDEPRCELVGARRGHHRRQLRCAIPLGRQRGHCQVNRNPLFFDAKSIRANTTNQRLRWHVDQWNLHEIS